MRRQMVSTMYNNCIKKTRIRAYFASEVSESGSDPDQKL